MTVMNRHRGFAAFDALLSIVPAVLMLAFVMNISAHMMDDAALRMHRQVVFDKVVSVADYTVKSGAVVREGGVRHPNWLDDTLLSDAYVDGLRERAGLELLHISTGGGRGAGDGFAFCICRLVVIGEEKRVAKLTVCGA